MSEVCCFSGVLRVVRAHLQQAAPPTGAPVAQPREYAFEEQAGSRGKLDDDSWTAEQPGARVREIPPEEAFISQPESEPASPGQGDLEKEVRDVDAATEAGGHKSKLRSLFNDDVLGNKAPKALTKSQQEALDAMASVGGTLHSVVVTSKVQPMGVVTYRYVPQQQTLSEELEGDLADSDPESCVARPLVRADGCIGRHEFADDPCDGDFLGGDPDTKIFRATPLEDMEVRPPPMSMIRPTRKRRSCLAKASLRGEWDVAPPEQQTATGAVPPGTPEGSATAIAPRSQAARPSSPRQRLPNKWPLSGLENTEGWPSGFVFAFGMGDQPPAVCSCPAVVGPGGGPCSLGERVRSRGWWSDLEDRLLCSKGGSELECSEIRSSRAQLE